MRKLETRGQPIPHLCARWLDQHHAELEIAINPSTCDQACESWRTAMLVEGGAYPKQGLVDDVDKLLATFAGLC